MEIYRTTATAPQPTDEVIVARPHVLDELRARLAKLTSELHALVPEATAHAVEGIPRVDVILLQRRIGGLRQLIERVRVIDAPGVAMLGSRVIFHHSDGSPDTLELVAFDEVNVALGRISAESPLGRALLGRGSGERVDYETPAGRRAIRIASVR